MDIAKLFIIGEPECGIFLSSEVLDAFVFFYLFFLFTFFFPVFIVIVVSISFITRSVVAWCPPQPS